jgi:hypothetical protein
MSGSVQSSTGNSPVSGGDEPEMQPVNTTGLRDSAQRFIALSVVSGLTFLLFSFLWSALGPLRFRPIGEFVTLNTDGAAQMPNANLFRTDLDFDFLPAFLDQLLTETLPTLGNKLLAAIVVLAFVVLVVLTTLAAFLGTLLVNTPIILLGGLCLVSGLAFTLSLFGSVLFTLGHVLFVLLGR